MPSAKTQTAPALSISDAGIVTLTGLWTADALQWHRPAFTPDSLGKAGTIDFDLSQLDEMDTFGAAALAELVEDLHQEERETSISGVAPKHARLVDDLKRYAITHEDHHDVDLSKPVGAVGKIVVEAALDAEDIAEVQGHILWSAFKLVTLRGPIRPAAIANQFLDTVLRAIPIVALICLVVGIILTQQSIAQLRNFGATVFVVDLGGILMLREVGILLAAIMVAGRSGSAITAEIGSMKMREEIDALEIMGLDTYRAVIMPRVIALVAGLPALGLIGAIAGIAGAALVARISGGISLENFAMRLNDVVNLHIIAVGMIKAPFMAFAIAVIAASEGLRVSGSTQSLGKHTTASVVKSIFMVIVIDGIFAIFFEAIGF
ncbi:ABC transporter permease [Mariluticola halotolerans]|uniref:ABC transporter permease n=1 Tax=Mariluticola halotolerans TaxID=2909283 RepID=UPI0026E4919F|nr:ABC transporter permease [Mariluticola halotolerans]UJQ94664.1 ABC transporter permease [Mariluticola halotolerans]